jgi:hypothetical protein
MNHSSRVFISLLLIASFGVLAGCFHGKKGHGPVAAEAKREGRDRELLSDGITEMQKGDYTKSRLLLNTLINT